MQHRAPAAAPDTLSPPCHNTCLHDCALLPTPGGDQAPPPFPLACPRPDLSLRPFHASERAVTGPTAAASTISNGAIAAARTLARVQRATGAHPTRFERVAWRLPSPRIRKRHEVRLPSPLLCCECRCRLSGRDRHPLKYIYQPQTPPGPSASRVPNPARSRTPTPAVPPPGLRLGNRPLSRLPSRPSMFPPPLPPPQLPSPPSLLPAEGASPSSTLAPPAPPALAAVALHLLQPPPAAARPPPASASPCPPRPPGLGTQPRLPSHRFLSRRKANPGPVPAAGRAPAQPSPELSRRCLRRQLQLCICCSSSYPLLRCLRPLLHHHTTRSSLVPRPRLPSHRFLSRHCLPWPRSCTSG